MPRFSERMGFRPVKSVIQLDSMDDDLRNGLWNALSMYCWDQLGDFHNATMSIGGRELLRSIWADLLKQPVHDIPSTWYSAVSELRVRFFSYDWRDVYDFVEFVVQNYPMDYYTRVNQQLLLVEACQEVLKRELSGYRFVDCELAPITNEQEIEAIESAIGSAQSSKLLNPTALHLKAALSALKDRESPDYRTSVKESISAVEAICQRILGDDKATLGAALARIEGQLKFPMHHNLKEAFNQLYKYTSDADGIRHAMKDAPTVDVEDALFMLVSCSALVNYLIAKAEKAGVDLKGNHSAR